MCSSDLLGTLQVSEDCDRAAALELPDSANPARVIRLRSVRHVEADDIDPRIEDCFQDARTVRRGTEGGDDAGTV